MNSKWRKLKIKLDNHEEELYGDQNYHVTKWFSKFWADKTNSIDVEIGKLTFKNDYSMYCL